MTVGIALHGDVLSITASLDNAEDKTQIWTSDPPFRRSKDEDVVTIEGEIATQIAEQLFRQLTGQSTLSAAARLALSKRETTDVEAYNLYREGFQRNYIASPTPDAYLRSIHTYELAITKDPQYAKGVPGHCRRLRDDVLRGVDGASSRT